ncbi:MAG TPA: hypothetical protein VIT43_01915 [Candidatus Dormibacteraeota bacterium]
MSSTILAAVAVIFIVACLAVTVTFCVSILRKGESRLKGFRRPGRPRQQAKITADEIIDLHLALRDVENLRDIADQIPA